MTVEVVVLCHTRHVMDSVPSSWRVETTWTFLCFYSEDSFNFKLSHNFIWLKAGLSVVVVFNSCSPGSYHSHQSASARGSRINNLHSAENGAEALCLWSLLTDTSSRSSPMINVPVGQRKLTWIYIITCLKVDLELGAIGRTCTRSHVTATTLHCYLILI